jgi:pimeloyl-ACP methyl ester carboxylesterase
MDKVNGNVAGRPKTLDEAKAWLNDKLRARAHPMNAVDPDETPALIDALQGLDGTSWAKVWGDAGDRVAHAADDADAAGDHARGAALNRRASAYYFLGRFPCPNHPAKERCAVRERETYVAAAGRWPIPIERIAIPFAGREGEGREIVFYLRRPPGQARPPIVMMWGGVDAWKEQMTEVSDAFLARGIATLAMDNAGTGEAPVKGVPDAERYFVAVMDWVAAQGHFDAARLGLLGRSFGGYWATKLAHLHPQRIAAAVNWGGGAHFMFQPEWVEASRFPDSYLMELVETRSRMLGAANDAEYVEGFRRLSLADQGLLDQPSAPLLLVNGKDDRQCPVADIHLLIEHGSPKSVRLFPGGHMGHTPQTLPTIVAWVERALAQGVAQ